MPSSKLALSFRMFHNGQLVREDTLTQSVIKIGKVPSAHLQLADESVSRMHAIVEVTAGEVSLIDLGSTRGSFVNGKRINKARLESGDVITLGDTRIELAIADAAPVHPPALPTAARRAAGPPAMVSGTIDTAPPVPVAPPAVTAPPAPVAPASARGLPAELRSSDATVAFAPPVPVPPTVIAASLHGGAPLTGPVATVAFAPPAPVPPAVTATSLHGGAQLTGPVATAAFAPPVPVPPTVIATSLHGGAQLTGPVATAAFARAIALPVEPVARPVAPPAMYRHAVAEAADDAGAARAVEVAAMLGDSVIGVKHCIDPRSGRVTPATWGLVAAAAACLVASAIAFAASVWTAADNRARLDAWTRIQHRPAYAFRPHRLGPAADWIAFGGSALALVGLGLGIARMRRERVSPYYRIGTAPGVECALEGAPAPAFPLVAPAGDDFVFQFAPGIDGELLLDGASTPLAALAAAGRARPSASTPGATEVPIPRNARIRARAGQATFMVAAVARPRRHAAPLLAGLERRTAVYVAGSLAAHLALWAVLQLLPPDATGANVDLSTLEPVTGHVVGTSTNDPLPPPPLNQPGESGGGEPSSPAMALPPGAAGNPDATDRGRRRVENTGEPPSTSRDEAVASARRAGLLGDQLVASAVDALAERPDFASGWDLETTSGPLVGGYGDGPGHFGGGLIGFGSGGGCSDAPCGLYPGGGGDGHSPFTTIGNGPGAGDRWGLPGRGVGSRAHRPVPPTLLPPEVSGAGYDKSVIRRYIRRNIDKIGYCYDKQLLAHPELHGEITVTFFIAPTGSVQTASGTGFDREVATCVAGVIQAIEFPRPGDGTGVQVNYPFQFHSAG